MRTRVALSLMACILLAGLLAGCGEEGDQSANSGGSQDGGGSRERGEENQGAVARKKAPQTKMALGKITSVGPDKVVLRPSTAVQGSKPMVFKIKQNTKIRVNGQEAELADVQKGQDAQIHYVGRNKRRRALEVAIVGGG